MRFDGEQTESLRHSPATRVASEGSAMNLFFILLRQARTLLFPVALLAAATPLFGQDTHRANFVRAQSQFLSAPDSASLSVTGDFTLEMWVKFSSLPAFNEEYSILTKWVSPSNRSYYFSYVNVSGTLNFFLNTSPDGASATSGTLAYPLSANTWYHLAASKSGSSATIYVNGVSVGTIAVFPTAFDGTAPFDIGASSVDGAGTSHFNGYIDDVRLWGVARTQAQFQAAMFSELLGNETSLRAYWKLNNSLADATANGNTLAPVSAPTFATNDLPFATSANQLEWCVDKDTKGLFHLNGDGVSAIPGTTLTPTGTVNFGAGKFSSGADFGTNNTTKSLSTSDPLGIDGGPITLSCWVKLNTEIGAGIHTLLDQANNNSKVNYIIDYEFNGGTRRIGFHRAKPGVTDHYFQYNVALGTSAFHLLTLTYDGATLAGYLDGILVGSAGASGNGAAAVAPGVGVAIRNAIAVDRASAIIDEVLVSGRALTAEEVMKYYGGIVSARFAPDANPEITSVDGHMDSGEHTTWASSHDAIVGNVVDDSGPVFNIGSVDGSTATYNPDISRGFALFDTSSIPNSAAVGRGVLSLFVTAKYPVDLETPNDSVRQEHSRSVRPAPTRSRTCLRGNPTTS